MTEFLKYLDKLIDTFTKKQMKYIIMLLVIFIGYLLLKPEAKIKNNNDMKFFNKKIYQLEQRIDELELNKLN